MNCDVCGVEPAYIYVRIGWRKGMPRTDLPRVTEIRHYCLKHHSGADVIRSLPGIILDVADEIPPAPVPHHEVSHVHDRILGSEPGGSRPG